MANYWIDHKGKQILVTDFRNLSPEEMLENIRNSIPVITGHEGNLLVFCRLENCLLMPEFMEFAKKHSKEVEPKFDKYAVTGMNGLKKILLNSYSLFTNSKNKAFSTELEALDYLVS